MKRNIFTLLISIMIFAGCSNGFISCADNKSQTTIPSANNPQGQGGPGGFGQGVTITDDGSTTNYVDTTTASPAAVVEDDLYQNFIADGTVAIKFTESGWETGFEGDITSADISIKEVSNIVKLFLLRQNLSENVGLIFLNSNDSRSIF